MKRLLQSAPVRAAIAWAAAAYLTFVARTTRWQVEGEAGIEGFAVGPPCIVAFWHEVLPAMPILWLRKRALSAAKPAVVLASRHRDGQLIGAAVKRFGIRQVAASSSRGGAAGLRGLIAALESGSDVGLTPDGPRGPRRIAAPGVAQLAAISGARVLACAAATEAAVQLQSWDRMRFPLPFGRGRLVCAPLIEVKRDDWQGGLQLIEAALNDAARRAGAAG
jgi:lysophospholipid acyltransferase (LPLAT)-like uncharacterized protein